jgi:hypothetical protein
VKSIYFYVTSSEKVKKHLFWTNLNKKVFILSSIETEKEKRIKWTGFTKKLKRLVWIIWIIQVISDHNQQTAFGDLANVH